MSKCRLFGIGFLGKQKAVFVLLIGDELRSVFIADPQFNHEGTIADFTRKNVIHRRDILWGGYVVEFEALGFLISEFFRFVTDYPYFSLHFFGFREFLDLNLAQAAAGVNWESRQAWIRIILKALEELLKD